MAPRDTIVLFKDRPAGKLVETDEGCTFTYHDDWQAGDVACALPAAGRVHHWRRGLHPFFTHLGTEGVLRAIQAQQAAIDPDDDLGLLLTFGRDCIGAVGIVPDRHVDPSPGSAPLPYAVVTAERTISGVQSKILAHRMPDGRVLPVGPTGPAHLIVKLPSPHLPDIVRNEYHCLRAASILLGKSEVTGFELGRAEGFAELSLLVHRFDRTAEDHKLRFEDLAQVLSKPRGRDFAGKYDASYQDAAAAIRQHSARLQIDLRAFWLRIVVQALLGDCDGHLKNFGLLERPEGLRLAPAYDLVSTVLFAAHGFKTQFGLRFDSVRKPRGEIDRQTLVELGGDLGLAPGAVDSDLARLTSRFDRALAALQPKLPTADEALRERLVDVLVAARVRILEG